MDQKLRSAQWKAKKTRRKQMCFACLTAVAYEQIGAIYTWFNPLSFDLASCPWPPPTSRTQTSKLEFEL